MNKTIKKLNITIIIGILAVWVSGSLFHFVYDWTGRNTFVGLFFPTNESTWEHMKLAFLPMNLYGIYTWYALKDRYEASAFAILLGANVATWAIPFLYYTYMGVLGFSKMWIDIATFFVAVLIGFAVEYHVLSAPVPRDYEVKMNKKERRAALKSALTSKVQDNKLVVVDSLALAEVKTKEMQKVLTNLKAEKALVITADNDQNVVLSARNIADVETATPATINTYDVMKHNTVVVTKDAVASIEEVYA